MATASTTYEEPYNTARKFASLDLISGGRAGWIVVTTATEVSVRNFNLDRKHPHANRYQRASEHVEVVRKLRDRFEDNAFIRDEDSRAFLDRVKLHRTDHKGAHFKVEGPLNAARSAQVHPVIVQAGQSEDGRNWPPRRRR